LLSPGLRDLLVYAAMKQSNKQEFSTIPMEMIFVVEKFTDISKLTQYELTPRISSQSIHNFSSYLVKKKQTKN